jgi:Fur family ferric uptake transcriptional regulator
MHLTDEQIGGQLHEKGLRVTAPRVAILGAMLDAGCPLSESQIAEQLGDTAPDKTTIYRTLMCLVEADLVHKAFVQHRQWYFEMAHHCSTHQCHPHFTCIRCQRTECLHDVTTPLVQLPRGMTMTRQQIRIEGVCTECCSNSKDKKIR